MRPVKVKKNKDYQGNEKSGRTHFKGKEIGTCLQIVIEQNLDQKLTKWYKKWRQYTEAQ